MHYRRVGLLRSARCLSLKVPIFVLLGVKVHLIVNKMREMSLLRSRMQRHEPSFTVNLFFF